MDPYHHLNLLSHGCLCIWSGKKWLPFVYSFCCFYSIHPSLSLSYPMMLAAQLLPPPPPAPFLKPSLVDVSNPVQLLKGCGITKANKGSLHTLVDTLKGFKDFRRDISTRTYNISKEWAKQLMAITTLLDEVASAPASSPAMASLPATCNNLWQAITDIELTWSAAPCYDSIGLGLRPVPEPHPAPVQSPDISAQCTACRTASCDLVLLHASACLHPLTHIRTAPEGPCTLLCLCPLLAI